MTAHFLPLPKVIGHRGACHYAPENTLASFQRAYELKTPWVEFDVMLSKEGTAIVIHDETLSRTTNGWGKVAETLFADITALDAGSWFDPSFAGEKIPTFVAVLACAAKLNLGINVEIKPTVGKDQETALSVVRSLQHHWTLPQKLLVSSFSIASLVMARGLDKTLPLGLLLDHWTADWKDTVVQLNCISLNTNYRLLTKEKVAQIKDEVPYVLAYTVDDPKVAQKLFSWGVDAVFSNIPDVILSSI